MAKLLNGDRAQVDLRKLTDYVLSSTHRTGRHKARVFAAASSMTPDDAPALLEALMLAARSDDAVEDRRDEHGAHYSIEFAMEFNGRKAQVRSLWTIRAGEDYPRFVTAFVAKKDDGND